MRSNNEDEQAILDVLITSKKLSRTQIEQLTDFNKSKAVRLLNSLCEKGLVLRKGSGNNIKYQSN